MSLRPDVVFLGTQTEDLPALYGMLDLVVLPSLREGLSLTLLEALASGKPAVTTDVSSNRTVISRDYLGAVVPPGNVPALAGAIIGQLRQPVGPEVAEKRRQYVRDHFSASRMVAATEELFKLILT